MRKYMLAALAALCLAFPGTATASFCPVEGLQWQVTSPEMDPQLVQDILEAAAGQCEWDYPTLRGWYEDGELTIEEVEGEYQVNLPGGIGVILIEDSF